MNQFKIPVSTRLITAEELADEVRLLVSLVADPVRYYNHLQEERHPDETIKQTFERVEMYIEQRTGLRHYSTYESFRVAKHRIQARKGIGQQPTLFD